jgi:glucosamine--fructose-6-phosphate aminotransferase (isomerizing)
MCGIVAVLGRTPRRSAPSPVEVLVHLDEAVAARTLAEATVATRAADRLLYGVPGVTALLDHPGLETEVSRRLAALDARIAAEESVLEARSDLTPAALEATNADLIALRDVVWAIGQDRLRTARAVGGLAGRDAAPAAIEAYTHVQRVLSSLDRLEVRGRDSAGIHLLVTGHDLDLAAGRWAAEIAVRSSDPLFTSRSVRIADGALSFVYKAAAEIGELGDNTRALRAAIAGDDLLRAALAAPAARMAVLAHTRWASVGIISEPNAHPVNSEELDAGVDGPYVVAALNGDVDNHADLKALHGLRLAAPITTDAKVIPSLVSRAAAAGDLLAGFRRTVASFDGSVAIAAASTADPRRVLLAVRGSGQGLYVGLAEDCFMVASEPYGLVEETVRYVRLDGETPAVPGQPSSRGQVVVLDADAAGDLAGMRRVGYDGTELPVTERDVVLAEVTTRDIDRGPHPHFLLKEITESPDSFRKTLRGKIVLRPDGLLEAAVGDVALPEPFRRRLAAGAIRRIAVIGQGTAAVAGQSAAAILKVLLRGSGVQVEAITATEFSGFGMDADLSDLLVIAVSQSGTTTDTNRTVDLARGRGAFVIGIVNRRSSDLTDKADGVLYTSDGRDVEMSVASTKAFYAQVAAGALLSCAVADAMGAAGAAQRSSILSSLRELPGAMREVLARREAIAQAAQRFAPSRRYWAVVGNGPNTVAAEEVRIKLSELCYKSIACDVTEDKKHIDLSSEPMILVCAAGLVGSTADDVAKEVAIYRAHKAAPIVIASEGEERFAAALAVLPVPSVAPELAFVLSAMVGHLFGYEAALAIDASARPLREAREVIEHAAAAGRSGDEVLALVRAGLAPITVRVLDGLRAGQFDGHLEASTAVRLAGLLRDVSDRRPLDAYQAEHGKVGLPAELLDDLTAALTRAIEELTRPVDAIKHQAKTVTVGISRSDEGLLANRLVRELLATGTGRDRLTYRTLQTVAALDGAVAGVLGWTRYRIDGDPAGSDATIGVVDRGGISRDVASRTDRDPVLRGTKRFVANDREVLVARGRADGRTVVLVPEVKGNQATGMVLLHVHLHDRLPAATARTVLSGYRGAYQRLVDWVTETEAAFRDDLLERVAAVDLLTEPVSELADRWRR